MKDPSYEAAKSLADTLSMCNWARNHDIVTPREFRLNDYELKVELLSTMGYNVVSIKNDDDIYTEVSVNSVSVPVGSGDWHCETRPARIKRLDDMVAEMLSAMKRWNIARYKLVPHDYDPIEDDIKAIENPEATHWKYVKIMCDVDITIDRIHREMYDLGMVEFIIADDFVMGERESEINYFTGYEVNGQVFSIGDWRSDIND